jgi:NAD(P)H-flavin reductase/ferredoxin
MPGDAPACRVRVEPSGQEFEVAPGETVLNAALRQGIGLHYGCRQGNCSSCKYFLVDGEVDFGKASPYALSEEEREEGWALLCCARPLEDLEIQDHGEADERSLPLLAPVEARATIAGVAQLNASLWQLRLTLDHTFDYYPGQFVELGVPGRPGEWRAYSIANAAGDGPDLEFILKRIPDGAFSGQIDTLAVGQAMGLRGPFGTSYLRDGDGPILLVATGSGLAPLRAMLQDACVGGDSREIQFYYGARTRADLPVEAEIEAIRAVLPRLDYRPCLSRPTDACRWEGRASRVTQAIQREVEDASPYDAYLCGAPDLCDAVGRLLEAKGIDEGNLFFDRFHPAT